MAAVYVATASLGLSLGAVHGVAAPVWPPTGISLAALLLFGYRLWPGVAGGAFLANLFAGVPLLAALGIAAGNTLEALLATYLLRRIAGFRNSLERLQDVLALIVLGALLSTLVSATIGVTSVWLGGVVPSVHYADAWLTWWVGNSVGDLLVAPILLVWSTRPPLQARPGRYLELAVLLMLLGIWCRLLFDWADRPVLWTLFPFVVWAALRLGVRGTTATVLLASGMAIWGTKAGLGPLAGMTLQHGLLLLQLFTGVLGVTGLALAVVMAERERAEQAVRGSEERFHALIEDSHDAIILIDAGGTIVYASPSTAHVHGSPVQVGRPASELVHPDERERLLKLLADLVQQEGHVVHAEYRVRHQDGSWRWVEGTGTNALADPRVQAIVGNYREITERKQAEDALRNARDELERRVLERTAELRAANDCMSELSSRLLTLQDEERRRIGQELHENTAQNLAGVAMSLAQVQRLAKRLSAPAQNALADSVALVDRCSQEIRALSYVLHPPLLDETGLASAIQWYADKFAKQSGIAVDVDVSPDLGRLPQEVEMALFRIAQECLISINRQALSTALRVQIVRTPKAITLNVEDKGQRVGAQMLRALAGTDVRIDAGIMGMRERMRQLGGHLEIRSGIDGIAVAAMLPLVEAIQSSANSESVPKYAV